MITAYIWGAGASGRGFAFWGWAELEPRSARAPHIVCGWAAPKTEVPRQYYAVSQSFEARKVAHAPGLCKAHTYRTQAMKCADTGKRSEKSAASIVKAAINQSGRENSARVIGPLKINKGGQEDKVLKITNN